MVFRLPSSQKIVLPYYCYCGESALKFAVLAFVRTQCKIDEFCLAILLQFLGAQERDVLTKQLQEARQTLQQDQEQSNLTINQLTADLKSLTTEERQHEEVIGKLKANNKSLLLKISDISDELNKAGLYINFFVGYILYVFDMVKDQ